MSHSSVVHERDKYCTFDLRVVILWMAHKQRCSVAVKRIVRVWISQQLGKKHLKYVDHVYGSEEDADLLPFQWVH